MMMTALLLLPPPPSSSFKCQQVHATHIVPGDETDDAGKADLADLVPVFIDQLGYRVVLFVPVPPTTNAPPAAGALQEPAEVAGASPVGPGDVVERRHPEAARVRDLHVDGRPDDAPSAVVAAKPASR